MKRRGQAAMEFLMSYGWAILAVIVALATMAYFTGFYQRFIPAQCTIGVPFTCSEYKATQSGSLLFAITNTGSNDLTVINTTIICNGDPAKAKGVTLNQFIASQQRINNSLLRVNCGATTGSQYKADIQVTYMYSGDPFSHTAVGYLRAYVE